MSKVWFSLIVKRNEINSIFTIKAKQPNKNIYICNCYFMLQTDIVQSIRYKVFIRKTQFM